MKGKTRIRLTIWAAAAALAWSALPALGAQDATEILKKADTALVPKNAEFRWSLTVRKKGEPDKENRFLSFKKGDLRYLFYTYYPEASYGQSHMRIDSTIWIYLPLADDTVKTSYKSAFLNSGLSYADVMYNELARYYDAKLVSANAKAGGMDAEYDCYELELTAKRGADGYARIIAWIDTKTFLTVRRDYFALSGEKLKEISYGGFVREGNIVSAFKLEIANMLAPDEKTSASFWDMKPKDNIQEKYFSLNFIKMWQPEIGE
jgi:outer membrane lipoprotein-sorting protein